MAGLVSDLIGKTVLVTGINFMCKINVQKNFPFLVIY